MFLKLLVYLGVHFSRIIALFRLAKAQQRQMQKESHFVLSKNTGFVDAYTNMTSKATTITTDSVLSSKNISDCQIVFDAEVISYDGIFSLMERHKNQGNTFRIKPQRVQFILGSDGSDSKGEVLSLSAN
jgi:hypothetical protein